MVVSIACLGWTFKDFEPEKLGEELAAMNWGWVALAAIFDILIYVLQGWRWSLLLRPVADIPYARSIRAIYVGLFANEVLPLRTGEIIRCYLQARWSGLPFPVVLSSALIERVFDGFWLIVCLLLSQYMAPVPKAYVALGQGLIGVVVVAGVLLAAAMFMRERTRIALERIPVVRKLNVLLEDLHIIGHSRYLYISALASLPYLLLQVMPIWALTQAYGVDLSLGQAFVLMVILRLVSVVPQGPGNLGVYQAAAAFTLASLFGVDPSLAKRFSWVMWAIVTLPLLIAGFVALAITGIRLSELRREAAAGQQAH